MSALKQMWAMEKSGINPNSLNYMLNPLARAGYLSTLALTVSSKDEALDILSQTTLEVATSWYAGFKLTNTSIDIRYYKGAKGIGIGINTYIKGERSVGLDVHQLHFNGKPIKAVPHIDIHFKYHTKVGMINHPPALQVDDLKSYVELLPGEWFSKGVDWEKWKVMAEYDVHAP